MKTVQVNLKTNPYPIYIGHKLLSQAGELIQKNKLPKDAIIVTSKRIEKIHGKELSKSLKKAGFSIKTFTVPDGEKAKTPEIAIQLLEKIARYDQLKQLFIIGFGGGVIGDLAGFVAAIYKRGVPFVQVPTTLLAQIDSAIGGKTAVDLSIGKNLVGAFYQPKCVISDIGALGTLPKKQIRNGMAEAIKYGIIADAKLFEFLEKNKELVFNHDPQTMTKIVQRSSEIKRDVVLADEKETKGIREILNFGHTLGHAVEAAGEFKLYQHGEAIGIGMRMATELSVLLGMISNDLQTRIENIITDYGLPQKVKSLSAAKIFKLMHHDKKFKAGKNRFVLVQKLGSVGLKEGLSEKLIQQTIKKYC